MPIRVLVVDDAAPVRQLLRTALRVRGGFTVVGEAADGHEAVRLSAERDPDLVVLDLGLPDLAGRDVLTRLRAASPSSKVVVFTGSEEPDRSWIVERVEGYVGKEADLGYLVDLLESVGQRRELTTTLELPQAATSAAEARRFVTDTVASWNLTELREDAVLIVSELATNAVTHAGSTCRVHLSLRPSALRIAVIDAGTGTPDPQVAASTDEHGRGLLLVAALAAAWGLEVVPGDGKVVWAELPLPGWG